MDKVVRVADEAKVKDCKEDIDTLLVFVRLFHTCQFDRSLTLVVCVYRQVCSPRF